MSSWRFVLFILTILYLSIYSLHPLVQDDGKPLSFPTRQTLGCNLCNHSEAQFETLINFLSYFRLLELVSPFNSRPNPHVKAASNSSKMLMRCSWGLTTSSERWKPNFSIHMIIDLSLILWQFNLFRSPLLPARNRLRWNCSIWISEWLIFFGIQCFLFSSCTSVLGHSEYLLGKIDCSIPVTSHSTTRVVSLSPRPVFLLVITVNSSCPQRIRRDEWRWRRWGFSYSLVTFYKAGIRHLGVSFTYRILQNWF